MKKIILLFVLISTLITSCTSDDDGARPIDMEDPIIGTWKITQAFRNGEEAILGPCYLEETIVFTDEGKFMRSAYEIEDGNCGEEYINTGMWENLGNGRYKITRDNSLADPTEGTFTFSGNTMTIVTNDQLGEFREVLTRV
ncbi:lipocalin family protein [uncultured Aquimarina sp.]|uniref:lipocalin family protein n=1 Tax=uncultured Aquimarina sp. TaxID=575652 RepID=UPI002630168D|nr:lipocalin family protein [uncultured Aquimarina sp.]